MAARSMRPITAFAYASLSTLIAPVSASSASQSQICWSSPLFSLHTSHQQCSTYSTSAASSSSSSSASGSNVSYRIAVSYCGKGRKIDPRKDVRTFDLALLRSRGQTGVAGEPPRSGQDAFFIGSVGNSALGAVESVAFGVADGVGGWTESGIDPSAFSEGLCRGMAQTAGAWDEEGEAGRLTPKALMQAGYDAVIADPEVEGGGSTACVAIARPDGSLEVANLGDSGFVHYRPNATSFISVPQVHAFNTPYQLSLIPAHILRQSRTYGGEMLHDYPKDAAVTAHQLAHGDVLVFGTDGVWDNLNSADVMDIVRKEMEVSKGWVIDEEANGEVIGGHDLVDKTEWTRDMVDAPERRAGKKGSVATATNPSQKNLGDDSSLVSIQEKMAFRIAKTAQTAAVDMKRTSPFGRELQRWYPGEQWRGGKVDDIAVIVAVVVSV